MFYYYVFMLLDLYFMKVLLRGCIKRYQFYPSHTVTESSTFRHFDPCGPQQLSGERHLKVIQSEY